MSCNASGLVTAFALALLTNRVFLIIDRYPRIRYYAAYTPTFDCRYDETRREPLTLLCF